MSKIKKKICVVTGTRAEYGLLYWLMKEIDNDDDLILQTVVTGMHLSPEFGLTYQDVEKDFSIDAKVEMLLSSDTPTGISKSMGLALISFADVFERLSPDLVVILGDRYEIFSAASAAMVARIPIAHLHGGEVTEGVIDEAIRHSITKMSHLHFTATETYKERVIQLGENPKHVFNVGGLGLDNIKQLKLLNKNEFEDSIGFNLNKKNLLVTFHPVTLENSTSKEQFNNLLLALDSLEDTNIIFTKGNSDTNGRVINQMIDDYVTNNSERCVQFTSLGQIRFLSALQHVDAIVGNSSSGLIEAPSFNTATINIGDRQKGRIKADSIIDCLPTITSIIEAIEEIYTLSFREKLSKTINPYGKGGASKAIVKTIKKIDLSKVIKKAFFDIKH